MIPPPTTLTGFLIRQPDHQVTVCGVLPVVLEVDGDRHLDMAMDTSRGIIDPQYRRSWLCPALGTLIGIGRHAFTAHPAAVMFQLTGEPFDLREIHR